jgi:hypothetical protein
MPEDMLVEKKQVESKTHMEMERLEEIKSL